MRTKFDGAKRRWGARSARAQRIPPGCSRLDVWGTGMPSQEVALDVPAPNV
jgi:hypothetical protein